MREQTDADRREDDGERTSQICEADEVPVYEGRPRGTKPIAERNGAGERPASQKSAAAFACGDVREEEAEQGTRAQLWAGRGAGDLGGVGKLGLCVCRTADARVFTQLKCYWRQSYSRAFPDIVSFSIGSRLQWSRIELETLAS